MKYIINRGIGFLRKARDYLPRKALLQIYKAHIRSHLDYCDIIYHKPVFTEFSKAYFTERASTDPIHLNESFSNRIENVQYRSALAITGCIKGTSRERLYNELGLESLSDRRLFHQLVFMYKIINGLAPSYLKEFIPPTMIRALNLRFHREQWINTRTLKYRYSYFPNAINSWSQLSSFIKSSATVEQFKNRYIKFFKIRPNHLYGIVDPIGTSLLTRLRLGHSHLRDHKFSHNYSDTLDPLCGHCKVNETTEHFLLHCPVYNASRAALFETLKSHVSLLLLTSYNFTCNLLLYGYSNNKWESNKSILLATIEYLHSTKRFDGPLYQI